MDDSLNKQAVKAIRDFYNCYCAGHNCSHIKDCEYCNGVNCAYDCCECGADDFYEGYIAALKDLGKDKK